MVKLVFMDAIGIAQSGLKAASERLHVSAVNIANANTPGYTPGQAVQTSVAAGGVKTALHQPAALFPAPDGQEDLGMDLISQLAEHMQALTAFKANMAMIQSAEEMMVSVLDATA